MLTNRQNSPIPPPPHLALNRSQPLPSMYHLAENLHLLALGNGSNVGNVERARHACERPEPGRRDGRQGGGGAEVEDRGCASAVQVS